MGPCAAQRITRVVSPGVRSRELAFPASRTGGTSTASIREDHLPLVPFYRVLCVCTKKKKGNMPWCGMVPVPNALTPPGMGCRKKKAPFLLPRAVTYCRIFKCTANHCWSSCASSPCEKKRRKRMVRAGRMSRKPNGNGWRTGAGVPDGRSGGTPWQAGSEPATEGEITRDASLSRRLWVVGEHWLE